MNNLTSFEAAASATRNYASQATMVEQSRAIAEVQAAVIVAQNRPRDRAAAITEMMEVCGIYSLAEVAFFRLPRSGETIEGETIHLARELARCWGNLLFGVRELMRDDNKGESEMLAYAWDMQTNARNETIFIVPHKRDKKGGPVKLTSMADIYDNNANAGARRLRECIFSVLPVWYKNQAVEICKQTLRDGGGKPLVQRIAGCIDAYEQIGVTRAQLERNRNAKADIWTPEDVAQLSVMWKSIKRNEIRVEDEFPRDEPVKQLRAGADGFERASAGQGGDKAQGRPDQAGDGAAAGGDAEQGQDSAESSAEPGQDGEAGEGSAEGEAGSGKAQDAERGAQAQAEVPDEAGARQWVRQNRASLGRLQSEKEIEPFQKWLADPVVVERRAMLRQHYPQLAAELEGEIVAAAKRLGVEYGSSKPEPKREGGELPLGGSANGNRTGNGNGNARPRNGNGGSGGR